MTTAINTHPDYERIYEAVRQGDSEVQAAEEVRPDDAEGIERMLRRAVSGYVDFDALQAVVDERGKRLSDSIPKLMLFADPESAIGATWADAFMTGVRFQQLGGHREVPEEVPE